MRRIFPLLGIALFLVGGFAGNSPIGSTCAQSPAGSDCEGEMAIETAAYIQSAGISITGNDAQFYGNSNSRVYLLNSEESINLRDQTSFANTFAVIELKAAGGKGVFFTMQQEIAPDHITFTVKQSSQVLRTLTIARQLDPTSIPPVPTPTPIGPPPISYRCARLQQQYDLLAAEALRAANITCENKFFCTELCISLSSLDTISLLFIVRPTSLGCQISNYDPNGSNAFWRVVSTDPLMHQALDNAVRKQGLLYKTSY